jgi:hypothetical protein
MTEDILRHIHALISILRYLREPRQCVDMTWQIDWLERHIERLKGTTDPCPRCDGTGEYECGGTVECCRACAGTGRMTKRDWNAWCDRLNSAPTVTAG